MVIHQRRDASADIIRRDRFRPRRNDAPAIRDSRAAPYLIRNSV